MAMNRREQANHSLQEHKYISLEPFPICIMVNGNGDRRDHSDEMTVAGSGQRGGDNISTSRSSSRASLSSPISDDEYSPSNVTMCNHISISLHDDHRELDDLVRQRAFPTQAQHFSYTQDGAANRRKRPGLSNLLFYAIFALGLFSFGAKEVFIRMDHSRLPSLMSQLKKDFVVTGYANRPEGDYRQMNKHIIGRAARYNKLQPRQSAYPRVFYFDITMIKNVNIQSHEVELFSAEFSDNIQLYSILDSNDGDMSDRDTGQPKENGECAPTKDWQTSYYPSCNTMHELDLVHQTNPNIAGGILLFGTNGHWRNAWKVDYSCSNDGITQPCNETVVLKTLKLEHNFEDASYENSRIDAMAMERLTSSPHVINIFGACGNSVITEYADGERVGSLADKMKKTPLARLKIARDIASGLADVHSIDGDEEATFVHRDVNMANVVSIGGTLKLNDFNVGVILQRNETSGKMCGFPAKYPNPQWRSPEEANGSQQLTEKIDVYSLGHIFFRLVCLHEPWFKLESDYTKGDEIRKEIINGQVKKGVLPSIPKEVMETTDAEVRIIREAMLACYTFDPMKRPTANTISNFLDRGVRELSKHARRPGRNKWGSFRIGK